MILRVLISTLFLSAYSYCAPTRTERMTISKMRMSDLETSASGYIYDQQQGLPASYMQYTNHGSGRYYHAPDTVHYVVGAPVPVAPAVPETALRHQPTALAYATAERQIAPYAMQQSYAKGEIANYATEQLPKYVPQLESIKLEPRAPYYNVPGKLDEKEQTALNEALNESNGSDDDKDDNEDADKKNDEDEEPVNEGDDVDGEHDHDDDNEDDEDDEHEEHDGYGYFDDSDKDFDFNTGDKESIVELKSDFPVTFPEKFGKFYGDVASSYEAGNGDKSTNEEHYEHGEKGVKGYKNNNEFNKGEHANHDKENRKGYYDIEDEHKKGHTDTVGKYGHAEEEEKDEKGNNYGKSTYHKKGHKTNGFHNVYRKDEYKKDTDFYDDKHKGGHFDKHATFDEHHKASEGGFKKGGQHYADSEHVDKGKKGHYDKGHLEDYDQGHKGEKGEKSYYENHADYAVKGDSNSGKSHKFSKNIGSH